MCFSVLLRWCCVTSCLLGTLTTGGARDPRPSAKPRPKAVAPLRVLRVRASAYLPIAEGTEGGRWTKTERDGRASHGVAVDPRVIPLGTRLWVPGYGHAIADDIGSAIKGNRIDVRMQERDNMHRWGVRDIVIKVLG